MNQSPPLFLLTDFEHPAWLAIQSALRTALGQRQADRLAPAVIVVVHDLLASVFGVVHRFAFRRVVETDFGIAAVNDLGQFEKLLDAEIAEHGTLNLARHCADNGWQVRIDVPPASHSPPDVLVELTVPVPCSLGPLRTERLAEALGLDLGVETLERGSRVVLNMRSASMAPLLPPVLLDGSACRGSVGDISERLSYGVVHFSASGEIRAASPSMLGQLGLEQSRAAFPALAAAIPLAFHHDVIWGLALSEGDGTFENYRIRLPRSGAGESGAHVLFNVSGFRKQDAEVVSLWQVVSRYESDLPMAEGSILGETRVHNITRSYVPQLVEQKAREAVRLGKTSLSNERCTVAVLFCDVVGFTSYVERNQDIESIIDTLNSVLRRIAASVRANRGAIDKFMGDCMMALFESPVDAVLAAIDMQRHAEDINSVRVRTRQQLLQLRIGVHWGDVVIGNVGTAERLDWTAIGDVVNTASVIEKECRPGATLISADVREAIEVTHPGLFHFDEMFSIRVKGKQQVVDVCHVSLAPVP